MNKHEQSCIAAKYCILLSNSASVFVVVVVVIKYHCCQSCCQCCCHFYDPDWKKASKNTYETWQMRFFSFSFSFYLVDWLEHLPMNSENTVL